MNNFRYCIFLFSLALIGFVSCKKDDDAEPIAPEPEIQSEIYKKIDSLLSPLVEMHLDCIPSVAVGVTRNNESIFSKYYGYANIEHQEKLTENHYFRMASNSKSLSAIALLTLIDAGKIGLHDYVKQYIPDIVNISDPYNAVDSMKV